jgi:hypothetical protein
MDLSSGAGGLTLVALGLVWFFMLVPSWSKRHEQKAEATRERDQVRERLNRSVSASVALKYERASRTKRFAMVFAVSAATVSVLALLQAAVTLAIGAGVVFALATLLHQLAHRSQKQLLVEGGRVRTRISSGVVGSVQKPQATEPELDQRAWTPEAFPKQTLQNPVGTLESVQLAEVVEFEKRPELDSETLDEILRRRRAN